MKGTEDEKDAWAELKDEYFKFRKASQTVSEKYAILAKQLPKKIAPDDEQDDGNYSYTQRSFGRLHFK